MVDEFAAHLRRETLCPETDLHAFARRRKTESAILWGHGCTVIGHRRRLVRHPCLIKIVPYRVDDPLAILVRTERVTADRGLRRDGSIGILDEQIQTRPSVGHGIQRYD